MGDSGEARAQGEGGQLEGSGEARARPRRAAATCWRYMGAAGGSAGDGWPGVGHRHYVGRCAGAALEGNCEAQV
jgi:hypothetical protein